MYTCNLYIQYSHLSYSDYLPTLEIVASESDAGNNQNLSRSEGGARWRCRRPKGLRPLHDSGWAVPKRPRLWMLLMFERKTRLTIMPAASLSASCVIVHHYASLCHTSLCTLAMQFLSFYHHFIILGLGSCVECCWLLTAKSGQYSHSIGNQQEQLQTEWGCSALVVPFLWFQSLPEGTTWRPHWVVTDWNFSWPAVSLHEKQTTTLTRSHDLTGPGLSWSIERYLKHLSEDMGAMNDLMHHDTICVVWGSSPDLQRVLLVHHRIPQGPHSIQFPLHSTTISLHVS